VVASVYLAMAALLARRPRRDDPPRRLAAYAFATVAPAFATNFIASGWPSWLVYWGALCVNAGAIGCSALLALFAWSFPERTVLGRSRAFSIALAALGALACAISTAECWQLAETPLRGNRAQLFYDCAAFALILAGVIRQRRRARTDLARRQASALLAPFVITAVAIVGITCWEFTSTALAHNPYALSGLFMLTASLPVGMAAAVARYRLFDIDAFAPRAGVYALVAIASLVVYALVIAAAEQILRPIFGPGSPAARWVAVPVLVVAGAPIRAAAGRAMDRLFARDRPRFLARCTELVVQLSQGGAADHIEALSARALEVDEARFASLRELCGAPLADRTRAEVRRRGAMRVLEARDPEAVDALVARGIEVLVDVPGRDELLAVPSPLATRLLGPDERHALVQVGSAIAGAVNQDAAQRSLVRDAESARRQIAMELHDGVGATLAAAQIFTQLARRRPGAPGERAADPLGALERTLSDGLSDLRLAVLCLADDPAGWDQVLARLRRHMGDVCASAGLELDLTTAGDFRSEPGAAARLALLRLLQEALNNVVRHAKAERVSCVLSSDGRAILVEFRDDGVGLPAEPCPGRGLGNMERRVKALGGSFALESKPRCGVSIRATIPLSMATA
jgi:signal transduction histidine kinase